MDHSIHINNMEHNWKMLRELVKKNFSIEKIKDYVDLYTFYRMIKKEDRYNMILNILSNNIFNN